MYMSALVMGNCDGEGRGGRGFNSVCCSYSVSLATFASTMILSATRHRMSDWTSLSRISVCADG